MASTDDYVALITDEHDDQPLFVAAVRALTQGSVDEINSELTFASGYDLDVAVGVQLDAVGLWVGITRRVAVPLSGIYFSFDVAGLGFDEGAWLGPYDPLTGIVILDDISFRVLIRAKIGANHWDGTLPSLVAIMQQIFVASPGTLVFAQDNQDMTMTVALSGVLPTLIQQALLTGGLLVPKPEGVRVNYTIVTAGGSPLFGFDVENAYVSGFDVGAWGS